MLGLKNSKNALIHISDGASFFIGTSLCSFVVIVPSYVKMFTENAILLALIPIIVDCGMNIPQTFAVYLARKDHHKKANNPIFNYFLFETIHRATFLLIALSIFLFAGDKTMALLSFFILFSISNFSWGFSIPNWVDSLSLTIPDNVRVSFMGTRDFIARCFGIGASFTVPLILSLSVFPVNYGILFLIAGIFFTVGAIPIKFFSPLYEHKEEETEHFSKGFGVFLKGGFGMIFKNKRLLPFLIVYWALSISRITYAFFTPYVIDRIIVHFPKEERDSAISILNIAILVFFALTSFLVGKFTHRFGHKKALVAGTLGLMLCNVLIVAFPIFAVAISASFLYALFQNTAYLVSLNAIMDLTPKHLRSTITAFNNNLNVVFLTVFALLGGQVVNAFNYETALLGESVLLVPILIAILFLNMNHQTVVDDKAQEELAMF